MATADQRRWGPSEIDTLVLRLLEMSVPLILGWDQEKNMFLVADIMTPEMEMDDEIPFDLDSLPEGKKYWIDYQVSNGLPGDRSMCDSYYSYAEAQTAFDIATAG